MLLDIDLDELKFLVDPSYEFIKKKIPYIMEAYIKIYGEEYRQYIENNFEKINYVFLNTVDDLKVFITTFHKQLILEIYQKLYLAFNLEFSEIIYKGTNNFIEKILFDKNLSFVAHDDQLQILRNDIRQHLIAIKETEQEASTVTFLEEQIQYIDSSVAKFDQIMEILNPQIKLINDIKDKIKKEKTDLQRQFINNHAYLLTDKENAFIKENVDYDVEVFVKNSQNLYKYIDADTFNYEVFGIGIFESFAKRYDGVTLKQRKELLTRNGIDLNNSDIDLNDGDKLLKRMKFYYIDENNNRYEGVEALDKLEEELNMYADRLHIVQDYYKFLMPKDKFIEKYILSEDVVQRKCNKNNKDILSKFEYLPYLGTKILEVIESSNFDYFLSLISFPVEILIDDIANDFDIILCYVNLSPVKYINFLCDGKIASILSSSFGHECGHVANIQGNFCGLNYNNFTLFNELCNEYLNQKMHQVMDSRGELFNSPCIVNYNEASLYYSNYFLLEPIVEKYEDEIKYASMHGSIDTLIECIGPELFEKYLYIIHDFFERQQSMDRNSSDAFLENPDIVKKKIYDILAKVDEKHSSGRNKKTNNG